MRPQRAPTPDFFFNTPARAGRVLPRLHFPRLPSRLRALKALKDLKSGRWGPSSRSRSPKSPGATAAEPSSRNAALDLAIERQDEALALIVLKTIRLIGPMIEGMQKAARDAVTPWAPTSLKERPRMRGHETLHTATRG